jgi:hypothetical protein
MFRFSRSPNWIFKPVLNGDAGVLVPLIATQADLTTLFQTNSTGTFLWQELETPKTVIELSQRVIDQFDLSSANAPSRSEIQAEIMRFLEELLSLGAIQKSSDLLKSQQTG